MLLRIYNHPSKKETKRLKRKNIQKWKINASSLVASWIIETGNFCPLKNAGRDSVSKPIHFAAKSLSNASSAFDMLSTTVIGPWKDIGSNVLISSTEILSSLMGRWLMSTMVTPVIYYYINW